MTAIRTYQKETGKLYGVGVGPGDPELITLKAYNIFKRVPVIFVPVKDERENSIAGEIVRNLKPELEPKIRKLVLPMLKDSRQLEKSRNNAADNIWTSLYKGENAAFINVGDPLLYGTFIHVSQVLQKTHPGTKIEVIPGISSINAAAAATMTPLASGDETIAVLSGDPGEKRARNALENFNTVVFLKINTYLDKLIPILDELKPKGKSVYVRRCTSAEEEIISDPNKLRGMKPDYFSLLIVRK
jgi:precorrin-2/cobalt-factor-2 C20-methyltransferase